VLRNNPQAIAIQNPKRSNKAPGVRQL